MVVAIEHVVLAESLNVTAESIAGGIYTGQPTNADPNTWMIFPGFQSAVNLLETGNRFPIDTSVYRNFSVKFRISGTSGTQFFQVLYFEDENSIGNVEFGQSMFFDVQPNDWNIVSFDLQTQSFPAGPSGSG